MKKIILFGAAIGLLVGVFAFTNTKGLEPYCVTMRDNKGHLIKYNVDAQSNVDAKNRAESSYQGQKCQGVQKGRCK
jgi:hypothetical protein